MRKSAAALVLTLLASLAAFVPAVSAAEPKAVVIVGATHEATAGYRSSADVYYTVLRGYTSNVVKIYSPNATWSKVKAELEGASIVIYLGHGNGFPSPHSTTARPDSQNGFGLNATAGNGDSNTKYYGESYIDDVNLAPNAVVLFNRLCYASGNDETGGGASSLGVAQARVDNYAAGFLRAGARAVIADAIGSLTPYIRDLFTTNKSIDQIWRSAPNYNARVVGPTNSSRTAGFKYQLDPDSKQRYYRSVVGDLSMTADQVTRPVDLSAGSSFTPIDPVRVLDTRSDLGLANRFIHARPRVLAIAGHNGIPADAVAITGNLTVTGQTSSGYLSLGPLPDSTPATSTLNFPLSDTRANGVVVRLAGNGTLAATFRGAADARTHVILDVTGYYRLGNEAARYVPVGPERLLDTRSGNGLADAFVSGVPRTFEIAGRGTVPADATAVTGNLTVTGQASGGYVSLGPIADATPSTSTLNFPAGDTRANNFVVRLGDGGTLSGVFRGAEGATAQLILDVTGYYTTGPEGSLYVPLPPARVLDTRTGNGLSGPFDPNDPRALVVATRGGVPADAVAVTGNLTVTRQTSRGYLSVGPDVPARPETSNLNFPKGDNRANGLASPLADVNVEIVFGGGDGDAHVIFDVDGYFKAPN